MHLGIDDPRTWLDSTPDEVVRLWEAYYRIEPWGGEYDRHATQMELAEASFAFEVNSKIPKDRADLKYLPRKRKLFYPHDYAGELSAPDKKSSSIESQCNDFIKTVLTRGR